MVVASALPPALKGALGFGESGGGGGAALQGPLAISATAGRSRAILLLYHIIIYDNLILYYDTTVLQY